MALPKCGRERKDAGRDAEEKKKMLNLLLGKGLVSFLAVCEVHAVLQVPSLGFSRESGLGYVHLPHLSTRHVKEL